MEQRIFGQLETLAAGIIRRQNEYVEHKTATPPPWTNLQKCSFQARIKRLQMDLKTWDELMKKVESKAKCLKNDNPDKESLLDQIDEFQQTHQQMIDDVTMIILEGTNFLNYDNEPANNAEQIATTIAQPMLRIPTLNIQKYNGDYLKWKPFWQRFSINVHDQPYSKVEKLDALIGLLEGIAIEEVAGFEIVEENYDTVVATLMERFGNSKLILKELYANLRAIAPSASDAKCLRTTVNAVSNMCRQLENYGVDINNDALQSEIIDKMPPKQRNELNWIQIKNANFTTNMILEHMKESALKAEISAQNYARKPMFTSNQNFLSSPTKETSDCKPHFAKTVSTSTNFSSNNVGQSSCNLCHGPHMVSKCTKFVSPDEKLKQLRAKNYCTKCSGKSHDTRNCRAQFTCHICEGNHYPYLCPSSNSSTAIVNVQRNQGSLLTKETEILNPLTNETTKATVLFDSGSQQSYISNKMIKQLKLEKLKEEKLRVVGFGAKATNYNSSLVKFQMSTDDGLKDLYANSTKEIATAVPVMYADMDGPNDLRVIYKEPDILIGMDYFFNFINSFEKHDENSYLVNSTVGKIYCKNVPKMQSATVTSLAVEQPQIFDKSDDDVQKFWNLEEMGIYDAAKNDEKAAKLNEFKNNVKEKEDLDELPTNAEIALGRLKSTFKRLSNDRKLLSDCEKIINDQITRGTVEIAPEHPQGRLLHYISSHDDIQPGKTTTKVRGILVQPDRGRTTTLVCVIPVNGAYLSDYVFLKKKFEEEIVDSTFSPTSARGGERIFDQYKKMIAYLDELWNVWKKDYLNFLRERNINEHAHRRGSIKRSPKVNESVLVYEPDIARGLWKAAKIKELVL